MNLTTRNNNYLYFSSWKKSWINLTILLTEVDGSRGVGFCCGGLCGSKLIEIPSRLWLITSQSLNSRLSENFPIELFTDFTLKAKALLNVKLCWNFELGLGLNQSNNDNNSVYEILWRSLRKITKNCKTNSFYSQTPVSFRNLL